VIPAAPADLISGRGGRGQRLYIVPSLDLVVVRHGTQPAPVGRQGVDALDDRLWRGLITAIQ